MKAFIVLLMATVQLGAFYLKSHAQSNDSIGPFKCAPTGVIYGNVEILLADETTLNYTKTGAIIECSSQAVFNKIFATHSQLFQKFTCKWIHGNGPSYKLYTIYLSKGDAGIIVKWAKQNL